MKELSFFSRAWSCVKLRVQSLWSFNIQLHQCSGQHRIQLRTSMGMLLNHVVVVTILLYSQVSHLSPSPQHCLWVLWSSASCSCQLLNQQDQAERDMGKVVSVRNSWKGCQGEQWTWDTMERANKAVYMQSSWSESDALLGKPDHHMWGIFSRSSFSQCLLIVTCTKWSYLTGCKTRLSAVCGSLGSLSKKDLRASLKSHPRTRVPWGREQISHAVEERKFRSDAGNKSDSPLHSLPA